MYKLIFTALLTIFLTACGGGSSSSTPTPPVVVPPPPPPPAPSPKLTAITGVITGFGSVFVNGVEYETDSSEVSTDDNSSASESDLQIGMVISLTGSVNDDGTTGTAESIHYEEQVKGPLESIDLAASSLVILGQTVLFDELTSLDNLVLIDIVPGDFLEISGFVNAEGQLYATRIEKENPTDTLKVEGAISALDGSAKTFNLADLVINYSSASFVNLTETDLANDLAVRVKGDVSSLVDGTFTVNQIKAEAIEEEHNEGDNRHLEGVITTYNSSASFVVNDVNVITTADTEYEHGNAESLTLNVRVKVKGAFDANNSLVASEVRIHQRTELKLEGAVQAVDLDNKTLTVLDVVFITDQQTKLRDESDHDERFFDLTDLVVGDFVEVKGFVDNNGNNFATKLERKNEDTNTERELKGTVSNIDNTAFIFTLVDVVVNTSDATLFEGLSGDNVDRAIFFEQLADGMHVEVKGSVTDNIFTASKVQIEEERDENGNEDGNGGDNGDHRTEFRGTIESLADTSFVVSGHTVNITDATKYEVNDEMLASEQFWTLVKIGDQVKVKGDINADGVITAKKVALEIEHQDNVAEVELQASGTLLEEVLTIGNHKVEFDQQTEYKGLSEELTLDEFLAQAGSWQQFKVKGTLREDVIFARKIEQREDDEDNNTIELSTFIEAFTDNGLTVAGHVVKFNDTTDFVADDNSLTLEEFTAQATLTAKVKIKGVLSFEEQSDGTELEIITASEVELKVHD